MASHRTSFSLQKYKYKDAPLTLVEMELHNTQREYVKNADLSLSYLNRELIPEAIGRTLTQIYEERIEKFRASNPEFKPKKNAVGYFDIVVALPHGTGIDVDAWSKKSVEFCDQYFASSEEMGSNILSARLHMDEANPHIHILVSPITRDGKFAASEFLPEGPSSLRKLQTEYAKAVEEFGLERGQEYSLAKNKPLKQFYRELYSDTKTTRLPEILPGESAEKYRERAEEVFETVLGAGYLEKEQIKATYTEMVSKERASSIELKKEVKASKEEISILKKENASQKKELEGMEHELGGFISLPDASEKVLSMESINIALTQMQDQNQAAFVRNLLNDLIKAGRADAIAERDKRRRRKEALLEETKEVTKKDISLKK
jgi:hypothetical protein